VVPRAGLGDLDNRKISCPHWVSHPEPSTLQPSLCNVYATTGTLCDNKSCYLVANYPCFGGTHSCSFWEVGNSVPVQKTFCFADRTHSWPADLKLLGRGNPQLPTYLKLLGRGSPKLSTDLKLLGRGGPQLSRDLKLPGTGTHSYHQALNCLAKGTHGYQQISNYLAEGAHSYQQTSNCLVQEPTVTIRPRTAWQREPTVTNRPQTAWQREPTVTNKPQTAWYRNQQLPSGLEISCNSLCYCLYMTDQIFTHIQANCSSAYFNLYILRYKTGKQKAASVCIRVRINII